METVDITIERRATSGKGPARRLRMAGKVPAILYGRKRDTTSVSVSALEFERKLAHLEGSHLIRLVADENDREIHERMALLREAQRHPVSGELLHVDFMEVDLTERQQVSVTLHFVAKAAGTVAGGILQPILREIEVECLPTEIPDFIEVDVSPLGIHEAVHLRDIVLPAGVTPVDDPAQTVVTVLPPTIETKPVTEAAEALAAAPAEGAAAPAAQPEAAAPAKKGGGEG